MKCSRHSILQIKSARGSVPVSVDLRKIPIEAEVATGKEPLCAIHIEVRGKGFLLRAVMLLYHIHYSSQTSVLLLIGQVLLDS